MFFTPNADATVDYLPILQQYGFDDRLSRYFLGDFEENELNCLLFELEALDKFGFTISAD